MRRYPRIKRVGCPPSVLSCTAWGFSCLANYSASGELLPRLFTLACAKKNNCSQRTGGVFSVTLSVNARFRECCPRILRGMLPYGVRTFLQRTLRFTSDHLPSAQNVARFITKKREPRITRITQIQSKTILIILSFCLHSDR